MKRFVKSLFHEWPVHLFGLYLAGLLCLNKTFSYLFIWVGPLPLFISEAMLAALALSWVYAVLRKRVVYTKQDWWFFAPLCGYWLAFFFGIRPIFNLPENEVINTLKRSALGYYSFFGFFTYSLVRDRSTVKKILFWMFLGGVGCLFSNRMLWFDWWPRYKQAGIAAVTATVFVFLYTFFKSVTPKSIAYALIGAVAFASLVFTGVRSAFLGLGVLIFGITVLLVFGYIRSDVQKQIFRCGAFSIVVLAVSIFFLGLPPGFARYRALIVPDKQTLPEPAPTPLPVVKIKSNPPLAPIKAKPVEIPAVPKVENHTPSAKVEPVLKAELVLEDQYDSGIPNFNRESFLGRLLTKIEMYFSSRPSGGNALWRIRVWFDGIQQVCETNILFGMGFSKPFVAYILNPFSDIKRYNQAMINMNEIYDFKSRITDPLRAPIDDVVPAPPFPMTEVEKSHLKSPHWFGVDFHNSHVAIFYRMGFIGLLSFIFMNLLFFFRLWPGARQKDPVVQMAILFWLWYLIVAASNVVLEGPFLGVPFWVFIGLMLRYVKEQKETVEWK